MKASWAALSFIIGCLITVVIGVHPLTANNDLRIMWRSAQNFVDEGKFRLPDDVPETGERLTGPAGSLLTAHPPGLPLILAALYTVFGEDGLTVWRWLSVLVGGGITLMIERLTGRWYLAIFAMLSPPIVASLHLAGNDPLFILVLLLWFWWMPRANKDMAGLLIFGLLAAAACLLRYTGILFIPVGWFAITGRERLVRAMIYTGIAFVPISYWLWRNWLLMGTLTGKRPPSPFTAAEVLTGVASVVASWGGLLLKGLILWVAVKLLLYLRSRISSS
jgi:hypothetical protein